jgi:hypothetical protein
MHVILAQTQYTYIVGKYIISKEDSKTHQRLAEDSKTHQLFVLFLKFVLIDFIFADNVHLCILFT